MKKLCTAGVLLVVVCSAAASLRAHHSDSGDSRPSAPSIAAVAIASPADAVRVDGELTDAVWSKTTAVVEFVQRDPKEGATPTHPTEVRVAYDSSAVYVAVRATEPDQDRLVGMLTRRDESSPSDWIRIIFDSYRDRRTAYEFG